ncbi:MAG TPA: hypothetical protein PK335_15475 [Draconibacterium sp.]|nr:hypothetical protein [Draconibacterium sp.]
MKEKYIEDLKEIKEMMNRSSRFLSLSGISGVTAGIIALAGAYLAHRMVFSQSNLLSFNSVELSGEQFINLLVIALATMIVSIGLVIFLTTQETKKRRQKIWDHQTKRILINLFIPLVTGGIVCLSFLFKGFVGVTMPLTLIFYGLALLNVSKYTVNEIRSLGLIEIVLGLVSLQFIAYGLWFWAAGFGLFHIVYGFIVKLKYKS